MYVLGGVLTPVLQESQGLNATRITRVKRFCYIAISDDRSTHVDFRVDGYHGC